jgi:YD repeat-containing protein
LTKQPLRSLFSILLLLVCTAAGAEEWYLSNAAGMTLEKQSSRLVALRNKYSLSVEKVFFSELPGILREYYKASWIIEAHTLFENGKESRLRWIFRDGKGTARLVAAFDPVSEDEEGPAVTLPEPETMLPAGLPPVDDEGISRNAGPVAVIHDTNVDADSVSAEGDVDVPNVPKPAVWAAPTGRAPYGFIELYDDGSHIIAEHQLFDEGDELIIDYSYNKGLLVRSETRQKVSGSGQTASEQGSKDEVVRHISTDSYRYSRAASLRAVERVFHEKLAADEGYLVQLRFPHRILDSVGEENFVRPALAYGSDFLADVLVESGHKVVYTTNERGRIQSETHRDDAGKVLGELQNIWSGDRLGSVTWKTDDEERRTEYDYDREGDRIEERNYVNGTLERKIRRENKQEVEELYMNGVVILRAIWEDGRKISEERVRSNGNQR